MNETNCPKISLFLPILNGGDGVRKCLESVRRQNYPKNKIEIIVIDNGSTDNGVEIAKQYTKNISIDTREAFVIRAAGMHKATGDFVYMILEQDLELRGKDFLKKMIKPMQEDKRIVASFTRKYPRSDQPWITRFISYHPLQCDPLYEYLTYPLEKTFIENKKDYIFCRYEIDKIPIMGRMFYRTEYLKKTPVWNDELTSDPNEVRKVVKAGYNYFAYVPSAGIYHHHAKSLRHLISKRIRNLHTHYFPYNETIQYHYLNINKRREVLKMILWLIYANLFIPATIRGIVRFLKYKDWALLMEPFITITTTDIILLHFLKNKIGRKIIFDGLNNLLFR